MHHGMKILSLLVCSLFCAKTACAADANYKNLDLGRWKLEFGAEERLRVEQRQNFDLNEAKNDNGALVFQRFRVNGRAALDKQYEIFLEGLDGRVYSAHIKPTAQTDAFDLHQAYVRANNIGNSLIDLKAGRQEMTYGAGRLIGSATWSNRINNFDTAVAHYKNGGLYADLFYGSRVIFYDHSFNDWNRHDMLAGAYAGYQKDKAAPLFETYFLSNYDQANERLRRYTAGARTVVAGPGDIVFDIELPYQFGKTALESVKNSYSVISAYAFHFDARRSFDAAWKPSLDVSYDLAGGDRKAGDRMSNTFVPLYQFCHTPYGLMDFFRWENVQNVDLEAALTPDKKWKIMPGTNFFWLDSDQDAWYDSTGAKLRSIYTYSSTGTKLKSPSFGTARRYVGQEVSLVAKYDLSDPVKLEAGYAHFFSGDYAKDTGAADDADWCYLQGSLKI